MILKQVKLMSNIGRFKNLLQRHGKNTIQKVAKVLVKPSKNF